MTILHLWSFSTKLDIKSVTSFPLDLVNYTLKSPSCCLAEYLLSVIISPLPSQSLGPSREETNCLNTYGYLMLRDCGHLLMLRDYPLLGLKSLECAQSPKVQPPVVQLWPSPLSSYTHLIAWDVGSGPVAWGPLRICLGLGGWSPFLLLLCLQSLSAFSLW